YNVCFGLPQIIPLIGEESPVAQNLIYVETPGDSANVLKISTIIDKSRYDVGEIPLTQQIYDDETILANVSWIFGKNKKNIVYANAPAECERIVAKLTALKALEDATTNSIDEVSSDLVDFSEFLKKHIHKDYQLAHSILRGIAFHYGNMPTIIRENVEALFDKGEISFLVCTSTLLQGVNLPAQNIFMLKPTRGEGEPLTSIDFWNLAGRAGRLGKDLVGNVFLINPSRWQSDPMMGLSAGKVIPTTAAIIAGQSDQLREFISNRDHPSGAKETLTLEHVFMKFLNDERSGKLSETVSKLLSDYDANMMNRFEEQLRGVAQEITVPRSITEANISVSAFRQQEMLDYILKRSREINPVELIPPHPLGEWNRVYQGYVRLFGRIHKYFEKRKNTSRLNNYAAMMALRWIRGSSLAYLIEGTLGRRKETRKIGGDPSLASVIRDVMTYIEKDLRFRYVKYVTTYIDLLSHGFKENGVEELIARIPRIPLFLELGASSETMINLMGLGVSRTTASEFSVVAPHNGMSRDEIVAWLKSGAWRGSEISLICIREVEEKILHESE
ncbi:MAG: helicase-related protein, partial [Bdellovibrionota bacterium]